MRDSALAVQDVTKIPINHLARRARLPVDSQAMDATQDPVVASYRERIGAVDDEILDAVNRRVTLVAELHKHKREQGYPMRDPAREQTLIEKLNLKDIVMVGHPQAAAKSRAISAVMGPAGLPRPCSFGAIAPLMLKTEANPGGLPIESSTVCARASFRTGHNSTRT